MKSSSWKVPRAVIYLHNAWPVHRFITSAGIMNKYALHNLVTCRDLMHIDKETPNKTLIILEKADPIHLAIADNLSANQLFALIGDEQSDYALLLFRKNEISYDLICNTYNELQF